MSALAAPAVPAQSGAVAECVFEFMLHQLIACTEESTRKSGVVDEDEILRGIHNLTLARAWLRYCPTCAFENQCEFCTKVCVRCEMCSPEIFCPMHWKVHPGNPDNDR